MRAPLLLFSAPPWNTPPEPISCPCQEDLLPGRGELQVTGANLEQYCEALARHKLLGPAQLEAAGALRRGLRGVVTGSVLDCMGR